MGTLFIDRIICQEMEKETSTNDHTSLHFVRNIFLHMVQHNVCMILNWKMYRRLRQYAVRRSGYIYRIRPYCHLSFAWEKIME
jgi:hypothetical protein